MIRLLIILGVFVCFRELHTQEDIQRIKQTVISDGHPITIWEKGFDPKLPPILFVSWAHMEWRSGFRSAFKGSSEIPFIFRLV